MIGLRLFLMYVVGAIIAASILGFIAGVGVLWFTGNYGLANAVTFATGLAAALILTPIGSTIALEKYRDFFYRNR